MRDSNFTDNLNDLDLPELDQINQDIQHQESIHNDVGDDYQIPNFNSKSDAQSMQSQIDSLQLAKPTDEVYDINLKVSSKELSRSFRQKPVNNSVVNNNYSPTPIYQNQTMPNANLPVLIPNDGMPMFIVKKRAHITGATFFLLSVLISTICVFTVNGGVQNHFRKPTDITDWTTGTESSYSEYYRKDNVAIFKSNYETNMINILNGELGKNNQVSVADFDLDWNDVDFTNEGSYILHVRSDSNLVSGDLEMRVKISSFEQYDLADLDTNQLTVNPYVTDDPLTFQKDMQTQILALIKNEVGKNQIDGGQETVDITDNDYNLQFSNTNNQNPQVNTLDLTHAYDGKRDSVNYNNKITITANGGNSKIFGECVIDITPQPYDLNDDRLFSQDQTKAYNPQGDKKSGHMQPDNNYNYASDEYKIGKLFDGGNGADQVKKSEKSNFDNYFQNFKDDTSENGIRDLPISSWLTGSSLLSFDNLSDSNDEDDWNGWENGDNFWYSYKITAAPDNGIVKGEFQRHLYFFE